jgi:hypothetical protein
MCFLGSATISVEAARGSSDIGKRLSGRRHCSTEGKSFFVTKNSARAPLLSVKKVDGRSRKESDFGSPERPVKATASTSNRMMANAAVIQLRVLGVI